jgi:hypothetical protein
MTQNAIPQQSAPPAKKPQEPGTVSVEGHIRIFDPKTKEVIVEKRA